MKKLITIIIMTTTCISYFACLPARQVSSISFGDSRNTKCGQRTTDNGLRTNALRPMAKANNRTKESSGLTLNSQDITMRVYDEATFNYLVKAAKRDGAVLATALTGSGKTYWMQQKMGERKILYFEIHQNYSDAKNYYLMEKMAELFGMKKKKYKKEAEFCQDLKEVLDGRSLAIGEFGRALSVNPTKRLFAKMIKQYQIPIIFISPPRIPDLYMLVNTVERCVGRQVEHVYLSLPSKEDYRMVALSLLNERKAKEQELEPDVDWDWFFDKLFGLIDVFYEVSGGQIDITKNDIVNDGFLGSSGFVTKLIKESENPQKQFMKKYESMKTPEGLLSFFQNNSHFDPSTGRQILHYTFTGIASYEKKDFDAFHVFNAFRGAVLVDAVQLMSEDGQVLIKQLIAYGLLKSDGRFIRQNIMLAELFWLDRNPQEGVEGISPFASAAILAAA